MPEADFFIGKKQNVILYETPKLDKKKSTITLGFSMPLTGEAISYAPGGVKEAFYSVQKDNLGLNPIGLDTEFQGVNASFYATTKTPSPNLEVTGGHIKKLEVSRPAHKTILDDGDVRLSFRLLVPASQEVWKWGYSNFKCEVAVDFEELQPYLRELKTKDGDIDDGQGVLEMVEEVTESPADNDPKPVKKPKAKKKK